MGSGKSWHVGKKNTLVPLGGYGEKWRHGGEMTCPVLLHNLRLTLGKCINLRSTEHGMRMFS